MACFLVIDQGTTSTRAIAYSLNWEVLASHQLEFKQYFPQLGWVEHDLEEIWTTVIDCCTAVLAKIQDTLVLGLGISNQRETTAIWHKAAGKSIAKAIVWQDRRTADACLELKYLEPMIYEKTGLLLDPYFSATKISWLLTRTPGAQELAAKGELLFGTIDCYLLWRLTHGQVHATDISNAARTLLFNINTLAWDDELLTLFNVPRAMLPEVRPNISQFGVTAKALFGTEIPIVAMMGDQQAAMIGQGAVAESDAKCTYGTGCFLMINTGPKRVLSSQGLLNTVAYQINNDVSYAIEGSVFAAGVIVKWLRDQLHLIRKAGDSEAMAKAVESNGGVYLVPAFTGLGAPYWDATARGAIYGLTRDSSANHIVRAGLEAIAYQTRDLLNIYNGPKLEYLQVDGGMTANSWLMQYLADILQLPIRLSANPEATSLGIAYLLGLSQGVFPNVKAINSTLAASFAPGMSAVAADDLYRAWGLAVKRTLTT